MKFVFILANNFTVKKWNVGVKFKFKSQLTSFLSSISGSAAHDKKETTSLPIYNKHEEKD